MKDYKQLAEVYQALYEGSKHDANQIMEAQGIIVEMLSELNKYHQTNKPNEKSKLQQKRLTLFAEIVNKFSLISGDNYYLRSIINRNAAEHNKLKKEIESLNAELNAIKTNFENF